MKAFNQKMLGLSSLLILALIIIGCKKNDTNDKIPIVTTRVVSEIKQISAVSGGEITYDGSLTITARGVCWGKNENPTLIDNKTVDGAGAGLFSSYMTGLEVASSYYVRAYATNSEGTGYGMTLYFTTKSPELPLIQTIAVDNITQNNATSGGTILYDGASAIIQKGIVWNLDGVPTLENNAGFTADGVGQENYVSDITSLQENTKYFVRAYAKNGVGVSYGQEISFSTLFPLPTPCIEAPSVIDYDGNVYNTVKIGNQCWTKENLKTTKYRNGTAIEFPTEWTYAMTGAYAWYENDTTMKDLYGALYNWFAVVDTNGLCPEGWHVPTDQEFKTMIIYLGGSLLAGGRMKGKRTLPEEHPRWESPNSGATNESGYAGYPGGRRNFIGGYQNFSTTGYWWSSTYDELSYDAFARMLSNETGNVSRLGMDKQEGFSVRCIKD